MCHSNVLKNKKVPHKKHYMHSFPNIGLSSELFPYKEICDGLITTAEKITTPLAFLGMVSLILVHGYAIKFILLCGMYWLFPALTLKLAHEWITIPPVCVEIISYLYHKLNVEEVSGVIKDKSLTGSV